MFSTSGKHTEKFNQFLKRITHCWKLTNPNIERDPDTRDHWSENAPCMHHLEQGAALQNSIAEKVTRQKLQLPLYIADGTYFRNKNKNRHHRNWMDMLRGYVMDVVLGCFTRPQLVMVNVSVLFVYCGELQNCNVADRNRLFEYLISSITIISICNNESSAMLSFSCIALPRPSKININERMTLEYIK